MPTGGEGSLVDGGLAGLDLGVRNDAYQVDYLDAEVADPRLNSVFPNRGSVQGGTRLRLVGRDFSEGMRVRLGRYDCLDLEVENPNHLRCTTPEALGPDTLTVEVRWPGEVRPAELEDAFTYFTPVSINTVAPDRGPVSGGLQVEITGAGLVDPTTVRFGEHRAIQVEYVDEGRLVAIAPPSEPGPVDVVITNINGEATAAGAFVYTEPLVVDALEPSWGSMTGGDEVVLRGSGLLAEGAVRFGAADGALVESTLGRTRLRVRTPPNAPGLVAVELVNSNGSWRRDAGFLYVAAEAGPFEVVGAVPTRLPATGGQTFVVGGNGFDDQARVWLDDEPVACELLSAQALRCTAPPMAPGTVDVVVRAGDDEGRLVDGLFFFDEIEIFDVQPARGAVSGGGVVELLGRGLTPEMRLSFQGSALEVLDVAPDGDRAYARVPPGLPGWVGLLAETEDDSAFLGDAFFYFEPRTRYGGVWGEPIERAVNVTVLNILTGEAIPEAWVQVEPLEGDGTWSGSTNEAGQTTVSDVALEGPVSVTCAAAGFEVATFERVAAENLTAYLYPHEFEQGPGQNDMRAQPVLRGTVTGLNDLEKPLEPGMLLVAFVETTHTSLFNRVTLPIPGPTGILVEDGPFEITSRAGELAVVVTAAYVRATDLDEYQLSRSGVAYRAMRAASGPVAMGVRRFISISPGQVQEDLQVHINHPLDLQVAVQLDNPSGGVRGAPDAFEARPLLDLGPEGYYELDSQGSSDVVEMAIPYLPDLRDWDDDITMQWIGVARTEDWAPYSMTFHEDRTLEDGVVIGPFVGTPYAITPELGGALGPWRIVEWGIHPGVTGPTEPAQVNVVRLTASNGLPLWTYVTPGPVTRLQLPPLPEVILPGGIVPGDMYLYIETIIVDGRFDYADFTYYDLQRRKSSGVWSMPITD
jgi:hypothetical protein